MQTQRRDTCEAELNETDNTHLGWAVTDGHREWQKLRRLQIE